MFIMNKLQFKKTLYLSMNLASSNGVEPSLCRLGGDCIIHYATRTFIQFLDKFANQKGKASLPLRRRLHYPLCYEDIYSIFR